MTIYARVDLSGGPLSLDDYTPSLGESVGAAWDEAWATNPTTSLQNMAEMNSATEGLQLVDEVELPDGTQITFDESVRARPVSLAIEDQAQRIKDAGLEGMLQAREGYTQEALDILIAHKREENYRRFISEKAPGWHTPFTFGAALGASVLDPVNVASAFVPVVGEARLLSMLGKAGGIAGRALVRARAGAVEGAVGAAMVEPLVYAGQAAVQADYGMMDSLLNVGFGAVMGAGLQPLAGGVGDFMRAKRGLVQPWAVADKTDVSEALRLNMAERMERAFLGANAEVDAGQARQNALASAALFDARARSWAYDTGKTVEDFYDRYAPEFRSWQAPFDESPDHFLNGGEQRNVDTGRALYQPASMKPSLPQRFAEMPGVEADSSQWFGEGKSIAADGQNARKAVVDWARTAFPQGTTIKNADQGWAVQVTANGIKSSLYHGYDDLLARSVPFIPQIVEGGIHVASTEKKAGLMSHIFANKIRLDGKDYVVGFVLREDRRGNRFYDHELTEIIDPDWLKPGRDTSKEALGHRTNRGDVMNILRDKLGVNDGSGQVLFQTAPESIDMVRARYEGTEQWMKAPNGADTKLNEQQWLQVRTPEFKAWFGDWEADLANASKVVDENGEPLVVYHGTGADFEAFDRAFQNNYRNAYGEGFYFAEEPQVASAYGDRIMPVFLNARYGLPEKRRDRKAGRQIQALDYVHNVENRFWVVQNSNQIKSAIGNAGRFDPNNPSILFQPDSGPASARGSVKFEADGKAVITFFKSADFSSAPHELYHIFRREMAETALDPDASPRAREQWAKIEEFVGAKPGQVWTREMEEKFARAGERFLLEGKAPSNALLDVFTRLKQWFMEIYADADAAGLEISPAMREVFNNMFSVPVENADQSFRYAVGDLATREFEKEFAGSGNAAFDDAVARGDVETVQSLMTDSEESLRETVAIASGSEPELTAAMVEAAAPELAAADEAIARARLHRDVLREAVHCEMRR